MRWLVTGSHGMLGTDLVALLRSRGYDLSTPPLASLDITDAAAVDAAVPGHDVVVNCAAYTADDAAETDEPAALRINGDGPRLLAAACREHGARLVHVSTDYVFDGSATSPYPEDAPLSPASAYGRTKAAGEVAVREELPEHHLILRTAWLYGAHGGCFPKTIAKVAADRGAISVVTDQVGQPTWTADLADLALRLVEAAAPAGTYHATSTGQASWFEFAREVVAAAGMAREVVEPTTSEAFPRPAPRPAYSVLGHDALERLGVAPIGPWLERWERAAGEVLPQS